MAVQSAAEGWAALCARRVERQSIDPRSTSASGLGRVRTRWRGDLIEWIIFSIVYFAAKIVMRDGFRSIWKKQFQSFPSLRGFHTARVKRRRAHVEHMFFGRALTNTRPRLG